MKMTKVVKFINENGYDLKIIDENHYSFPNGGDDYKSGYYIEFNVNELDLKIIIEKKDTPKIFVSVWRVENEKKKLFSIVDEFISTTQKDVVEKIIEVIENEKESQAIEKVACEVETDTINNEGQGIFKSLETPQIKKESCKTEKTTNFEEEKNDFKSDLMGDINVCYELPKLEGIALGFDMLSLKSVKWNDLFCTEKDLLRALYQMDLDCYKENGQYYIQGFHKQLHNGKMLSPKQITQLKRMARFICLHYLRDTFHKYNGKKLLKPKTK